MSTPRFVSGDPWSVCDICGKWCRRSQTRKTWDGLRVCEADWDPKHPLLSIKARPDRQAVFDARPEPKDRFVNVKYDYGSFCLQSPGGLYYIVHVADDGAWLVDEGLLGTPLGHFHLGGYKFMVDDDGAVTPTEQVLGGIVNWRMVSSPGGYVYLFNTDPDGAVIPTFAGGGE